MTRGDGHLPGSGFDLTDPVEVLGAQGAIMEQLRTPDGRWRLAPVSPFDVPDDWPSAETTAVVIDTGVCEDHPTLLGRVVKHVDLTGEGHRDENGHGTAVAAIIAAVSPHTQIMSVKAMNAQGRASVGLLSHALWEAAKLLDGRGGVINLSGGRRTPSCDHDCPLCTTVIELQRSPDLQVVCAAGNDPGSSFCPAKSALSVTTPDEWAADGDHTFVPPNWSPLP